MSEGHVLFQRLAGEWLGRARVSESTMMGFSCLRVDRQFFASVDRDGENLLVKLPAEAVQRAIAQGRGKAFAPNGRVFKQWLAVPLARRRSWKGFIERAHAFVSGAPS